MELDYRDYTALVKAGCEGHERFARALADRPDLDPDALLAFAKAHQLKPWLAACADGARVGTILPRPALDALRAAGAENEARVQGLLERSRQVREAFAAEGIEVLFLKGLVHGALLYGDPARRFQADIDALVAREAIPRAVQVLGKLGYDTSLDAATREPLARRVEAMLEKRPGRKLRNSCTVARGAGEKLDLHWCIRTYYEAAVPARELLRGRRLVDVRDLALPTVSEEDLLVVLLLNVAADLRKARCRAKLFLDLYGACKKIPLEGGWEGFLERRRGQGIERLAVNVLALFLYLWRCSRELPELREALARRAKLIETLSTGEADRLVTCPRDDPANRRWHARIQPASPLAGAAQRLVREPAHGLARILRPRRGAVLLDAV